VAREHKQLAYEQQKISEYMEARRQEEQGRRLSYLKFLETQMKAKQDVHDFERQEKERMKVQIKTRA
jgi:hypothetical protein